MKPDHLADAALPAGQQLLFAWSPAENVPANQSVTPRADHSAETRADIESADASCPSCPIDSQAVSSSEAEATAGYRYPPNHPWHYTREGDNAPPVPFDEIPPAEEYGCSLERALPKPAAKRIIKARQLMEAERRDLEQARNRYEEVIARGAKALSHCDLEIAYGGNDELARAGTLALLYHQIAWRRGRIAYLKCVESPQAFRSP